MDIKVIVDDTTRLVCGLNSETTVQDVIIALANSLNTTGRFYLIEKVSFRDASEHKRASFKARKTQSPHNRASEPRIMAPHERPVDILSLQNKLLASNEFIEFHLFRSKYLALDNDQYSEKLIEKELIEKLNTLIDKPQTDQSEDYFESFNKDMVYQGQKGLKNENYGSLDNEDSNYQEYFTRSGSSLNSSMTQYSSSTTRSNDSNYYSSERTSSLQDEKKDIEVDLSTDNEKMLRSLLSNINTQQTILENQSLVMADLYKTIENYEIAVLELNQKKENFKVTLNNLELLNCLNSNKLSSLERNTNEMSLLKEIEFNQFLSAQRDYYERRLNELSQKSEEEVENIEHLSTLLKQLNNLPEQDSNGKKSSEEFSDESDLILKELDNAQKNSDLNRARLEYLQVSSSNLEKCMKEKYQMIKVLENQLKNLELKQSKTQSPTSTMTNVTELSKITLSEISEEEEEEQQQKKGKQPKYDILEEYNSQSNSISEATATESLRGEYSASKQKKSQSSEIEDVYSDYSIESSSSSESNSSSQETMATFLKYKRIREKSLLEKKRKSTGAFQKDNTFNEVFNTIHYF